MAETQNSNAGSRLRDRAALVQRGGARAAVLGVNDGLVSTVCLVIGVAAAGGSQQAVLTAGLAGLLAGAISMAAGEWISMKSQVELFGGVLADLRQDMKKDKDRLVHSLAHALASRGMEIKTAHRATLDIAKNDEHFTALYAAQVVGMNKDELGSPWQAAFSSFFLFIIGAATPILPWVFIDGMKAVALSVVGAVIVGLFVGGFVAYSSGRRLWYGALRQFLIIVGASAVTYGIGLLFGVATS